MRSIATAVLLLFSLMGRAQDDTIGVHGMALFRVGDALIASHMPLVGGIHAHQIVLAVRPSDAGDLRAVTALFEDGRLVSLLPEAFSLDGLRSGELRQFDAVVYQGHFERDGEAATDPIRFDVLQLMLNEPLHAGSNGSYYVIELDRSAALLVHRIGDVPSFDQIVLVDHRSGRSAVDLLNGDSEAPLTENDAHWLARHGLTWRRELYLETADFIAGQ